MEQRFESPTNLRPTILFIRGFIALAFGASCLYATPPLTFAVSLLFGSFMFVDGMFSLLMREKSETYNSAWSTLMGVFGLAAGLLSLAYPFTNFWSLSVLGGSWAFSIGILALYASYVLHTDPSVGRKTRWLFGLCGAGIATAGMYLIIQPNLGVMRLLTSLAIAGFLLGIGILALGLNVRRYQMLGLIAMDDFEQKKKAA